MAFRKILVSAGALWMACVAAISFKPDKGACAIETLDQMMFQGGSATYYSFCDGKDLVAFDGTYPNVPWVTIQAPEKRELCGAHKDGLFPWNDGGISWTAKTTPLKQ